MSPPCVPSDKADKKRYFARDDLKPYFSNIREKIPKNFDRDFGNAVRPGYIHENGSESYLTNAGVAAVEAGFEGKARPRGVRSRAANAKRKKAK